MLEILIHQTVCKSDDKWKVRSESYSSLYRSLIPLRINIKLLSRKEPNISCRSNVWNLKENVWILFVKAWKHNFKSNIEIPIQNVNDLNDRKWKRYQDQTCIHVLFTIFFLTQFQNTLFPMIWLYAFSKNAPLLTSFEA